jgi:hypothetical protein
MRKGVITVALAMVLVLAAAVQWSTHVKAASSFIYGNNATGGTDYVTKIDPGTFAVADTYSNLTGNNGRGVVVVNGTMYYTNPSSGSVFSYNTATHTNNGSIFSIAGTNSLSAIAFDGTNFWINDYSGTNQAYLYSMTGTLLKTIHLANATGNSDGFEYFVKGGTTPSLIANRSDGCCTNPTFYDIYDLNGAVTTAAFITVADQSTGIAYDGTNFLTSHIDTAMIGKYSGTTGTFISVATITGAPVGFAPLIEDLSADYAITLGTPTPTGAPLPSTLVLMVCGMLLVLLATQFLRRKTSRV